MDPTWPMLRVAGYSCVLGGLGLIILALPGTTGCVSPSARSVEQLFAPCLGTTAAVRREPDVTVPQSSYAEGGSYGNPFVVARASAQAE